MSPDSMAEPDRAGGTDPLAAHLSRLDDELCTWPAAPGLFTRANANDQWPKPITALTRDLIALPQERGLGVAFGTELGIADDPGPWTWNGVFYGWFTYAVEPAAAMADRLPGWSRAGVYGDYFGVAEDPDAVAPPGAGPAASPPALAAIGARFARALVGYPRRSRRHRAQAEARLRTDLARDWRAAADAELLDRLGAHVGEATDHRVPHALASVISASLFKSVSGAVEKLTGDAGLAIAAVTGVGGIHMREATAALGEVARGTLAREEFLDRYGYRGFNEFELAARPWRDDPAHLDRLIAAAGTPPGGSAAPTDDPAAAVRADARDRLRAAAGVRWPLLRARLDFVEGHLRWRENGKVPMVLATHSIRLVVREAGRRLAERGRLADPDDVYHLRLAELCDELTRRPTTDLAGVVDRRRRTHELAADLPLPEMIDAGPGSLGPISAERWRALGVLPPEAPETGDRLVGVPGSPGRVEGRARIVLDPDDVEIEDGDVIVARGTDSAWAVLFNQADAVVVDVGGPMSHSSIAARELGIPCVVNAKEATSTIREGQRVVVDGTAGVVHLRCL